MPRQNTHYLCFSDKIKGSVRLCQQIVKQCIRCINTICKIIPFTQVLTLCPYHMTAEHIICIAFPDDLRIVTGCCNRKSAFFYLICCGLLPNGRTAGGATGCKACQKPCNGQHTNYFFLIIRKHRLSVFIPLNLHQMCMTVWIIERISLYLCFCACMVYHDIISIFIFGKRIMSRSVNSFS